MSIIAESEFNGKPTLVLKFQESDRFPFQFGVKKAKLILEHMKAIQGFVEKHEPAAPAKSTK